MKTNRRWSTWWAVWAAAGVIAETIALRRKGRGDTLSAQVWALQQGLEQLGPAGKIGRWVLAGGLMGFLGWLIVHFVNVPG